MDEKELKELVKGAAREDDGGMKLACPSAFKLATDKGVPLREIGRVCNEQDIRICGCQLGCFE